MIHETPHRQKAYLISKLFFICEVQIGICILFSKAGIPNFCKCLIACDLEMRQCGSVACGYLHHVMAAVVRFLPLMLQCKPGSLSFLLFLKSVEYNSSVLTLIQVLMNEEKWIHSFRHVFSPSVSFHVALSLCLLHTPQPQPYFA